MKSTVSRSMAPAPMVEHCRIDVCGVNPAAGEDAGALGHRVLDQPVDALDGIGADNASEHPIAELWRPGKNARRTACDTSGERIGDFLINHHAAFQKHRARRAPQRFQQGEILHAAYETDPPERLDILATRVA